MNFKKITTQYAPLADRMRPKKLEDFFGQEELMGEKSFLRKAIQDDKVPSLIFWGPPGSGKTTLASIIANETNSQFVVLSGVTSGKKDLMVVIKTAKENKEKGIKTILFI